MVFILKLLWQDKTNLLEELKSLFLSSVFTKTVVEGIFNYGASLEHFWFKITLLFNPQKQEKGFSYHCNILKGNNIF